jgi:hypothetical protein
VKPIFVLCRILGNELPPRDLPGSRCVTLNFILDDEPSFPHTEKFWLLNRVCDPRLKANYRRILDSAGATVYDLLYRYEDHVALARKDMDGLLYCPGINAARNTALEYAFEHHDADYAMVFDGDCAFTQDQWEEVTGEIIRDAMISQARLAYSVPMFRIDPPTYDALVKGYAGVQANQDPAEPQLIISRRGWWSGEVRYDPSVPFGKGDKCELLFRLGHSREFHRQHIVKDDSRCRSVGSIYHLNTGDRDVEGDVNARIRAREDSLAQMYKLIDRVYGR